MNIEDIQKHCYTKKALTEGFPFDEETLVFKVAEKIFCLTNINQPLRLNLKCNPEKTIELREEYEEIIPGYHMNKKHWNTVDLQGTLKDSLIKELIDDSYNLVFASLPKKVRDNL
ncbi:MAG: MmcQ/YjbR family DNA-binding protein [Melioribacteraceae bacterium]|jgi:predicted DNA-binding protein (MmcQ/YjbR family)|nr:MmcQ/YjbR family DNA-binding protein [Melioribacteraceae bacterium]